MAPIKLPHNAIAPSMPGTSSSGFGRHGLIENTSFLFKRGMHHYQSGNYSDASQAFHRILRTQPRDPLSNYYMGLSKQKMGNHRRAIGYLKYSRAYFGNVPQVHAALGQSFVAEGKIEEARKVLSDIKSMRDICAGTCGADAEIQAAQSIMQASLKS